MDNKLLHEEVTSEIINSAYCVFNKLGWGFLEKVYRNALAYELSKKKLAVEIEKPIKVFYEGIEVGDYVADIIVENKVIVELKAVSSIKQIHEVQLLNYLKATGMSVGLLINFGEEIRIVRKIFQKKKRFDEIESKIRVNPR